MFYTTLLPVFGESIAKGQPDLALMRDASTRFQAKTNPTLNRSFPNYNRPLFQSESWWSSVT